MISAFVLCALFVVTILAVWQIARWSIRSQDRMFREDAEKRREMYERYGRKKP